IRFNRKSVTLVHKGNIMKFTEGAFRDWGYEVAKQFFGAEEIDGGPWCKIPKGKPGAGIMIKDAIADITLQQVLTRPEDFDVIASKRVTYDFARLMEGATEIKCSQFGDNVIEHM